MIWTTGCSGSRGGPDAGAVSGGRACTSIHHDLGVGFYLQGAFPFKFIYDCEVIEEPVGLGKRTTVKTPYGDLTELQEWYPDSFCIGWSERFIKSWRD